MVNNGRERIESNRLTGLLDCLVVTTHQAKTFSERWRSLEASVS